MKDPYWTYIDKLRGQIDELKAGVDFYEEVLRLRAEKIDLVAELAELEELREQHQRDQKALMLIHQHACLTNKDVYVARTALDAMWPIGWPKNAAAMERRNV